MRALFIEEAVVVLRTGREELSVFSLDGFVADFVEFIERAHVEETGFTERILDLRERSYGDIAQVLVHFDSHVPGSGRDPQPGVDNFELVRREAGGSSSRSPTSARERVGRFRRACSTSAASRSARGGASPSGIRLGIGGAARHRSSSQRICDWIWAPTGMRVWRKRSTTIESSRIVARPITSSARLVAQPAGVA